MKWNWKKILAYIFGAGVIGGFTPYLQSFTSGHPIALTFGTVGVPALITAAGAVTGLFSKQPTQ